MKPTTIISSLGLDPSQMNRKRLKMLPQYLRVPTDSGRIPEPTSKKQLAVWKALLENINR